MNAQKKTTFILHTLIVCIYSYSNASAYNENQMQDDSTTNTYYFQLFQIVKIGVLTGVGFGNICSLGGGIIFLNIEEQNLLNEQVALYLENNNDRFNLSDEQRNFILNIMGLIIPLMVASHHPIELRNLLLKGCVIGAISGGIISTLIGVIFID